MKRLFTTTLLLCMSVVLLLAGEAKKKVTGKVYEIVNNEKVALAFANVFIEGTTTGTVTDFDGNFSLDLEAGTYQMVFSSLGYRAVTRTIEVTADGELTIDTTLEVDGEELEEVQVVARANRESESMLLMEQKQAEGIKESIGAQQLSKLGVSDAASATSKISGVTKNEGSGDVYVRGLGDRYLSTTMNGLPVPSDDVNKKNIDLNLFSTDVIKNVGINKTYAVDTYGDQSSGAVNIVSKTFSEKVEIGLSVGSNSNLISEDVFGDFKGTQNTNNTTCGYYSSSNTPREAIQNESWSTTSKSLPIDRGISALGGAKLKVFGNDMTLFATFNQSSSFDYQTGVYQNYRSNGLNKSFSDVEEYASNTTTSGLFNLSYNLGTNSSISYNGLYVHTLKDELYESGRNGEGYMLDHEIYVNGEAKYDGAFVRDQNTKQTTLLVNQLLGSHGVGEKNIVKWAIGANLVNADEPNRIHNEMAILDENTVQLYNLGLQQSKSYQEIRDVEFNGYVKDEFVLLEEVSNKIKLNFGANFRHKTRDFESQFVGVDVDQRVRTNSVDNIDQLMLDQTRYTSGDLAIKELRPDTYNGTLDVIAGYANGSFDFGTFSGNIGVRYEMNKMDVEWDVNNYPGRTDEISNSYNNVLPAIGFKYKLNEQHAFRLAASKTVTLPEFKEIAPFEYVAPNGRVTKGNPELEYSQNYNVDIKWEMFPSNKELISATAFYKLINDPINLAQTRGSSGYYYYANTGEKANVYGLEAEARFKLLKSTGEGNPDLMLTLNATKMWFSQDLLEEFQYNHKTESDLQGASEFIGNMALTYSSNTDKEWMFTLSGNYSSDKIFALGSPEDFVNRDTQFNNEIIEEGFITLDFVASKKISDKVSLKFTAKNLANPEIKQTQEVLNLNEGTVRNEVVQSYKKGVDVKLALKVRF